MTTPQIELIDFRLIDESKMNPRKSFNEGSLKELSESIAKQGLLQPITVRIFKDKKIEFPVELSGKTCYEIVCGARRYRASVMAGMKVVPSIIKSMTDEEAFDAMITENLQRKDVAPMDEARAFNELHKRGVSFEELSARFGKSVQFVRLRVKLNDLSDEFVAMLDNKELQVSHALELCKLDPTEQENIRKEYYRTDMSYGSWFHKSIADVKIILGNKFKDLDKAQFDKTECESCMSRCGANVLFEEYSSNSCSNPICYSKKVLGHRVAQTIEKSKAGFVLFSDKNYLNEVTEKVAESGCEVKEWNYDLYRKVQLTELPDKSEYDENDPESLEGYYEDLAEAQKEIEDDNLKLKSGEYIPCFGVNIYGRDEEFYIKKPQEVTQLDSNEAQTLATLQSKDKRNAEIKIEKIIEDERKLVSDSDYATWNFPITDLERVAMYAVILGNCDYSTKRDIENAFDKEKTYLENIKELIGKPIQMQLIRSFIKYKICGGDVTYNKSVQSILQAISKEAYPEEAIKIELKHEDTYLKRKESIDQKIKELS